VIAGYRKDPLAANLLTVLQNACLASDAEIPDLPRVASPREIRREDGKEAEHVLHLDCLDCRCLAQARRKKS
jgi:hypothetical protein